MRRGGVGCTVRREDVAAMDFLGGGCRVWRGCDVRRKKTPLTDGAGVAVREEKEGERDSCTALLGRCVVWLGRPTSAARGKGKKERASGL